MHTKIKTRIQNKHDLEAVWISDNPGFIPLQGELIVFDVEVDASGNVLQLPAGRTAPYTYARTKIGDGFTNVIDLPFCTGEPVISWEGGHSNSVQLVVGEDGILSIITKD